MYIYMRFTSAVVYINRGNPRMLHEWSKIRIYSTKSLDLQSSHEKLRFKERHKFCIAKNEKQEAIKAIYFHFLHPKQETSLKKPINGALVTFTLMTLRG